MSFAQQLMIDCLLAQGVDQRTAEMAVKVVMGVAVAADLVTTARLDAWERDARIYQLRGQRVKCVDLSIRFGLTRSKVFEAIRKHQARRRAALRTVA